MMFINTLSATLLRLCQENELSYEAASELCALSSRHFGDIARGKTVPSINTLEKLCKGFALTPDELLIGAAPDGSMAYRMKMPVVEMVCYTDTPEQESYALCPRCGVSLEREYQCYCDRCGQCLGWKELNRFCVIARSK